MEPEDCDDDNAAVHPGAAEICDGLDNDCDGVIDADEDGDGEDCFTDCDDEDPDVHSSADETCDGLDNDCDGIVDEGPDADGDGYVACVNDCDDEDDSVHPGADEQCDNGRDDDCDGWVDCFPSGEFPLDQADGLIIGADARPTSRGVDVTDDGKADLVVVDVSASVDATNNGQVYIFAGALDQILEPSQADITLTGNKEEDYFLGTSVAAHPDLYGDSVPALAVGATGGSERRGQVHLFVGPLESSTLLSDAYLTLGGRSTADLAEDVRFTEDVLGGGGVELLVVASGADSGNGAAYLLSAPEDGDDLNDAAVVISGTRSVDSVPLDDDFDGDGLPDLALRTTNGLGGRGAVLVFEGPLSGSLETQDSSASIDGEESHTVQTLVGPGDLTGDGIADLLVGSSFGATEEESGACALLAGPLTTGQLNERASVVIHGQPDAALTCTGPAGDLDGDGSEDLLLSAYGESLDGFVHNGALYVVLGPVNSGTRLADSTSRWTGTADYSNVAFDAYGSDLDGDGRDDLIMSSYGEHGRQVSLVFGGWL